MTAAEVAAPLPPYDFPRFYAGNRQGRTSMRRYFTAAAILLSLASPAFAGDTIQDWATAKAPPVPEVKPVALDAKTTALLVLDLAKSTCNATRRPRCLDTLTATRTLLEKARAAHATVIYSLPGGATMADVLPPVAALPGEPHVQGGADKFLGTDLDAQLKGRGIKTVIVIGTGSSGAVLQTASQAGLRGYKVVLAEDGASAENVYIEQAVIDILLTGPGVAAATTLSRSDLIQF
jgi:nicotinamidase-related amidase